MKNILILLTTIILISACGKSLNIEMNLQQSELFLEQNASLEIITNLVNIATTLCTKQPRLSGLFSI